DSRAAASRHSVIRLNACSSSLAVHAAPAPAMARCRRATRSAVRAGVGVPSTSVLQKSKVTAFNTSCIRRSAREVLVWPPYLENSDGSSGPMSLGGAQVSTRRVQADHPLASTKGDALQQQIEVLDGPARLFPGSLLDLVLPV